MMWRKPERLEMEIEELIAIVARAGKALSPEEHRRLKAAVETLAWLTGEIEQKGASITRLQKLLFGNKTEKASQIPGMKPREGQGESGGVAREKVKPKGHGRNGSGAYSGAERIRVPHDSLTSGCPCPGCKKGKVYEMKKEPRVLVRVRGQAPLGVTLYEIETFRCNLCGEVYSAKVPEGVGEKKYDESAAAMIGLLKYGSGLPFNRIEKLEGSLGVPLPAATQWEIVREVAAVIAPAHEELIRQAARGEVLHNDDTPMRVLSLAGAKQANETGTSAKPGEGEEDVQEPGTKARTGVFTSGIVSTSEGRTIALFFTGRKHAGENLAEVLKKRAIELAPPIQMCDGLMRNIPSSEFDTLVSNCIVHGRRKFVDLVEIFPEECRHVIESLRKLYRNDAFAREQKLTAEARLDLHQKQSGPLMADLEKWMKEKIERKEVEPNSPLGDAISYMLKRWEKLTLFLRVAGAPLDNNICERILKKAILHRKNALFYKSENGARVGDLFMSLIHTAELAGENPFDYLKEIQKHAGEMTRDPASWMPWNYRRTLAGLLNAPPQPP
jgi:transposase